MVSKGLPPPRPSPPDVLPCVVVVDVNVDVDAVAVDCDEVTNEVEAAEDAWVNVGDVMIGIEVAVVELKFAGGVEVGGMIVKLVVLRIID